MLHQAKDNHYTIMPATMVLWTSVIVLIGGLHCKHLLKPYKHENTTISGPPLQIQSIPKSMCYILIFRSAYLKPAYLVALLQRENSSVALLLVGSCTLKQRNRTLAISTARLTVMTLRLP